MTGKEAERIVRAIYPNSVCRRLAPGVYCLFEAPKKRPGGAARLTVACPSRMDAYRDAARRLTGEPT